MLKSRNLFRRLFCLFVFLVATAVTTYAAAQGENSRVDVNIPYGSDQNALGVIPAAPGICPEAPQSFFVDGNTCYILDTVKKRIAVFNSDGSFIKEIGLAFTGYPRDIVLDGNNIFVLDEQDNPVVYEINRDGRILDVYNVFIPNFNPTKTAIKWLTITQNNRVAVVTSDYEEFELEAATKGVKIGSKGISSRYTHKVYTGRMGGDGKMHLFSTDGEIDILLTTNCIPAGAEVVGFDSKGNVYVQVGDRAATSRVIIESTIRKFDKKGKQIGVARVPLELCNNYPSRALCVDPAGKVYFMALKESGVEIQELLLSADFRSSLKEKEKAQLDSERVNREAGTAAVNSRQTTNDRAYNINNLRWYYSSYNASPIPTGASTPDWLLRDPRYGWKTGIPYCWGGFDAIDRSSRPASWSNFVDAMNKRKFAGNVNCSGGYKEGTAGLDCSGYVGACLGYTSKPSTVTLWNNSRPVATATWMDSYNNYSGHVLLFLNRLADGSGITSCESTTSGDDKCKVYSRSYAWLNSGGYSCRTFW